MERRDVLRAAAVLPLAAVPVAARAVEPYPPRCDFRAGNGDTVAAAFAKLQAQATWLAKHGIPHEEFREDMERMRGHVEWMTGQRFPETA